MEGIYSLFVGVGVGNRCVLIFDLIYGRFYHTWDPMSFDYPNQELRFATGKKYSYFFSLFKCRQILVRSRRFPRFRVRSHFPNRIGNFQLSTLCFDMAQKV